jgi:hypothetical protein
MTSALRELTWLEIQKNPGCTARAVEAALGARIGHYLLELYKARMVDRRSVTVLHSSAGGATHHTYTVACTEYKWTPPSQLKKKRKFADQQKKTLMARAQLEACVPTRQEVIRSATTDVDLILKQLDNMSIREVMRLRKGIDEALTI